MLKGDALHDGDGTTVSPKGTIVTLDLASGVAYGQTCAKPRDSGNRVSRVAETNRRSAVRPSGFAASLPVIVAAAFRLGLIAVIALAGIASFHH